MIFGDVNERLFFGGNVFFFACMLVLSGTTQELKIVD